MPLYVLKFRPQQNFICKSRIHTIKWDIDFPLPFGAWDKRVNCFPSFSRENNVEDFQNKSSVIYTYILKFTIKGNFSCTLVINQELKLCFPGGGGGDEWSKWRKPYLRILSIYTLIVTTLKKILLHSFVRFWDTISVSLPFQEHHCLYYTGALHTIFNLTFKF